MTPKTAIAYLRVSTDDQHLSLEAQATQITHYATQHNITLLASFADQNTSGATPITERLALPQVLHFLNTHKPTPTHLIVAKRDRLARDILIATQVTRSLPRNTTLVSADNAANGTTPADDLLRTILDGMASYERQLIRQRTSQALQALKAKGHRAGTIPYGQQASLSTPLLEPNPYEQQVIARILALHSEGYSQRTLTRTLHSEGYVSRKGTPLTLTQVQRILATHPHPHPLSQPGNASP